MASHLEIVTVTLSVHGQGEKPACLLDVRAVLLARARAARASGWVPAMSSVAIKGSTIPLWRRDMAQVSLRRDVSTNEYMMLGAW